MPEAVMYLSTTVVSTSWLNPANVLGAPDGAVMNFASTTLARTYEGALNPTELATLADSGITNIKIGFRAAQTTGAASPYSFTLLGTHGQTIATTATATNLTGALADYEFDLGPNTLTHEMLRALTIRLTCASTTTARVIAVDAMWVRFTTVSTGASRYGASILSSTGWLNPANALGVPTTVGTGALSTTNSASGATANAVLSIHPDFSVVPDNATISRAILGVRWRSSATSTTARIKLSAGDTTTYSVVLPTSAVHNDEFTVDHTLLTPALLKNSAFAIQPINSASTMYIDAVWLDILWYLPFVPTVQVKRWDGSAWVPGSIKRWDGSGWVTTVPARWDGSAWV